MLRDDNDELMLTEDHAYILGVEFKPTYFEEHPSGLPVGYMSIFGNHEAFDRAITLMNLLDKAEAVGAAKAMSGNLDDDPDAIWITAEQARLLRVEFRPTRSIADIPHMLIRSGDRMYGRAKFLMLARRCRVTEDSPRRANIHSQAG
jgi:hypothetical protein